MLPISSQSNNHHKSTKERNEGGAAKSSRLNQHSKQDVRHSYQVQIDLMTSEKSKSLSPKKDKANEATTIISSIQTQKQQENQEQSKVEEKMTLKESVLQQQVQFMEEQLQEAQQKLKTQEEHYMKIIETYQNLGSFSQDQLPDQYNQLMGLKNLAINQARETTTLNQSEIQNSNLTMLDNPTDEKNQQLQLQIKLLNSQLSELNQQKIELSQKLQLQEIEHSQNVKQMKFKMKDQKLQMEDIKLKMKHTENRINQKDEQFQRITEDLRQKYEIEIENIKRENDKQILQISERDQMSVTNIRDIHEVEQRQLQHKITELKSQIRCQDLQIQELQCQTKEKVNSNMEILETIHLRYLDEIKSLNINLSSFKIEKEDEISYLKQKLNANEEKARKLSVENSNLTQKLEGQRKEYESKIIQSRKKIDDMYRQLAEHEKCEITIQAQRRRITDLKVKIDQLEQKDKWNWKSLVRKRGEIENEKVDLRRKINSSTRVNDDLEKKMNVMKVELESAAFQKQILKNKLEEVQNEMSKIKNDPNLSMTESKGLNTQRVQMTRSISPKSAMEAQKFLRGSSREYSKFNKTQINQTLLKRLGSARCTDANEIIKVDRSMKVRKLVSPRDHMIPKLLNSSRHAFNVPKKSTTQIDQYYDQQQSSRLGTNKQDKISITENSQMPSPIVENRKAQSKLLNINVTETSRPNTQREVIRQVKPQKYKKHNNHQEYDDTNSFLASPKQDIMSFFNGSSTIQYNNLHDNSKLIGPSQASDSTMVTRANRSKAVSHYDIRCKQCQKMFDSIDSFLKHQNHCQEIILENYDNNVNNYQSNQYSLFQNESPQMKQPMSINPPPSQMLFYRDNEICTNDQYYYDQSRIKRQMHKHQSQNNLSTPQQKSRKSNNNLKSLAGVSASSFYSRNILQSKSKKNLQTLEQNSQHSHQPMKDLKIDIQEESDLVQHPQLISAKNELIQQQQRLTNSNLYNETLKIDRRQSIPLDIQNLLQQSQNNFNSSNLMHNNSSITTSNRQTNEVEKENYELMHELKKAKTELAITQEQSASNELLLKKELLNLQYQLNQILQQNNNGMSGVQTPVQGFNNGEVIKSHQSFTSLLNNNNHQQNQSSSSNNSFVNMQGMPQQTNINIQTTNVTCYNIGSNVQQQKQQQNQKSDFGFNKARQQHIPSQNTQYQSSYLNSSLTGGLVNNLNQSQFIPPKTTPIKDNFSIGSPQVTSVDQQQKHPKFNEHFKKNLQTQSEEKINQLKVVIMRTPSENIDSPEPSYLRMGDRELNMNQEQEQKALDSSKIIPSNIRINRSPNLMLRKLQ
eukprot:403349376